MAGKPFCFLFLIVLCTCFVNSLKLKQVLVLSRHNIRTPISDRLLTMSPKPWLEWNQSAAQLTEKGAMLERYQGEYFSEWLQHHGLIPQECPDEDSIHIYANTRQRTRDTAKAFVDGAFRNCNIPVISINSTEMDPIFNPIIHNTTEAFRDQVYAEMNEKLRDIDLKNIYTQLNRISDIKNSQICKENSYCDLVADKNDIVYKVGEEPDIAGPVFISAAMVDSFLMAYCEGHPLKDIAWGEIETENELELMGEVLREYQSVRFNLRESAKDFTKPLLQYMKEILSSNKKFIVLVGHDSNLNSVFGALGVKEFSLPGQLELSPIGAKLVFQRWSDDSDNDFLKVEYVYESWPQIRNAEKLSMVNPPKNITIFFNNMTETDGYYTWTDFETLLQNIIK